MVPSYFPDYYAWPPSTIEVYRRPDIAVYLVFQARQSGAEALWIVEALSIEGLPQGILHTPSIVAQAKTIPVKDRQGTLTVGLDASGNSLYRLQWSDGQRYYLVSTTHSLEDVIRISESMVRS